MRIHAEREDAAGARVVLALAGYPFGHGDVDGVSPMLND